MKSLVSWTVFFFIFLFFVYFFGNAPVSQSVISHLIANNLRVGGWICTVPSHPAQSNNIHCNITCSSGFTWHWFSRSNFQLLHPQLSQIMPLRCAPVIKKVNKFVLTYQTYRGSNILHTQNLCCKYPSMRSTEVLPLFNDKQWPVLPTHVNIYVHGRLVMRI